MIRIQQANFAQYPDRQAVWQLMNHYACDPMGGGQPLPDAQHDALLTQLADWQATRCAVILLAWQGEQAVGLLNAFEGFSTFAALPLLNIHDLVVHSAARGQGVGRQLLQAAEQIARARGCCKITLEVLSGNQTAQALYTQQGYAAYVLDHAKGSAQFWQKSLT
jgi:ribosomal protein S18 acetylase RimI-like enzyme